ncbi:MAG: polysaccharide deacetylase family protein [Clostridiales bacterium]|nr:polysaccharide deacetylase family protein [Clostridiales bacterium]
MKAIFWIKKLIKLICVPSGIIYNIISKRNKGIKILMYHRVKDDVQMELSVNTKDFQWQMEYLKRKGYKVISMDEACERIKNKNLEDKLVVLTFDDGYEDYYHHAYPILEKYGYPSMVYLVPSYIERKKVFWWDEALGESPLLSWQQIKELQDKGLTSFGSHTWSHTNLRETDIKTIRQELTQSKNYIEDKLNIPVKHFAYPGGYNNGLSQKLVKGIYTSGTCICDGISTYKASLSGDLSKIARVPVQKSDGKVLFAARLRGWIWFEKAVCRYKKLKNNKKVRKYSSIKSGESRCVVNE